MPTDEVIENKDVLEENTPGTGDGIDCQITADRGSADEPEQESEQTDSDDGDDSPAPSPDPLPDTDGDEPSEAPVEPETDSDSDSDSDSIDSHCSGEPETDDGGSAEDAQDSDGVDGDTVGTGETKSDSSTTPDGEAADGSDSESEPAADGSDEAGQSEELAGDGDTDTVDESESADDGARDDIDIGIDIDIDTDTGDTGAIGDVVIESDGHVAVPLDLPNIEEGDGKPVSLRDGINSEYDDIDRKSRVPHAVKIAAGTIATVAVAAALVTSTVAVMVVEIRPSVIGGETIASQQAGGIDGSGKKITASYTVGDALHSSDSDGPEILSWTDRWYAVAPGAKSIRTEIESAGKGSRIDLSDGTSIDVDGRYASRTGSFDAGIDIAGIDRLYGDSDDWVAIRYDASHVLVGKRVAGGEGEGE